MRRCVASGESGTGTVSFQLLFFDFCVTRIEVIMLCNPCATLFCGNIKNKCFILLKTGLVVLQNISSLTD